MATDVTAQDTAPPIAVDDDSDYGSDLDEATVDLLYSQSESQTVQTVLPSIEAPVIIDDHGDNRPLLRLARIRDNLSAAVTGLDSTRDLLKPEASSAHDRPAIEIEYDESNRRTFSPPPDEEAQKQRERERQRQRQLSVEPGGRPDTRTPLQRFRTPPKKPLSVTDLVSPAWCELQYWYNLTRYGRVRATAAMKQGSSVHKVLEEQVHTEVPVDVATKEDRFALRMWNVIQGLRTLRQTGMTREMEVWGLVEGEVINGIIDQITMTCPDLEAEMELLQDKAEEASGASKKQTPLPSGQKTLKDYLTNSQGSSVLERNGSAWLGTLQDPPPGTLYIVDIKTRQSKSLPQPGSQTRPTHYQLMLYHRLFSTLAANGVPADRIFHRYAVDPFKPFSDTFLAQMSTLSLGFSPDGDPTDTSPWEATADDEPASSSAAAAAQDATDLLLAHNNLTALWSLMISEFSRTIPTPPPSLNSPSSISPLLTAEFRTPGSGSLIGKRSFPFNPAQLAAYVADELKWWRGERETRGVDVEEAFKCRICEFAEGCAWRATKVEEGIQKARLRREGRRKSEI